MVEEGGAVLAVVHQLDARGLLALQSLAHDAHLLGIGFRTLQKATIAADAFLGRVSRKRFEPARDMDQRPPRQVGVGEGDGGLRLIDRLAERHVRAEAVRLEGDRADGRSRPDVDVGLAAAKGVGEIDPRNQVGRPQSFGPRGRALGVRQCRVIASGHRIASPGHPDRYLAGTKVGAGRRRGLAAPCGRLTCVVVRLSHRDALSGHRIWARVSTSHARRARSFAPHDARIR